MLLQIPRLGQVQLGFASVGFSSLKIEARLGYLKFCSHFFDCRDPELRKVGEVGVYLIRSDTLKTCHPGSQKNPFAQKTRRGRFSAGLGIYLFWNLIVPKKLKRSASIFLTLSSVHQDRSTANFQSGKVHGKKNYPSHEIIGIRVHNLLPTEVYTCPLRGFNFCPNKALVRQVGELRAVMLHKCTPNILTSGHIVQGDIKTLVSWPGPTPKVSGRRLHVHYGV